MTSEAALKFPSIITMPATTLPEKKRKPRQVPYEESMLWNCLAGDDCLWVELTGAQIEPRELTLACGRQLRPGDRVTQMGGKRKSAGFHNIRMIDGHWLVYLGTVTALDGDLCLFQTGPEPKDRYVGFQILSSPPLTLHRYTPSLASRIVETTAWEFSTPEPK